MDDPAPPGRLMHHVEHVLTAAAVLSAVAVGFVYLLFACLGGHLADTRTCDPRTLARARDALADARADTHTPAPDKIRADAGAHAQPGSGDTSGVGE